MSIEDKIDELLAMGETVAEKLEIILQAKRILEEKWKLEHETILQIFNKMNTMREQALAQGIPDVCIERACGKFMNKWYSK